MDLKATKMPWRIGTPQQLLDFLGDAEADIADAMEIKKDIDGTLYVEACRDQFWFLIRDCCDAAAEHVVDNPHLYGLRASAQMINDGMRALMPEAMNPSVHRCRIGKITLKTAA